MKKKRLKHLLVAVFSMIFVITAMVRPVQAGHFNSSGSGYGHFVLDGNEKIIGHSTLGYYQPWNSYYFDTATMEMGAYNESTDEQTLTIRYYITHYGSNYCWADLPGVVRVNGKTVATFKGWWYNPNNEAAKRISNTTILYGETTVKLKAPGTYKIEVGNVGTGDNNTISISVGASIAIDLPTYTVTFVDGLGSTLKTQKVTKYQNATPPSSPSRTGYTFAGWSGSYSNVTSNRTITATWSPNTYYVYYNTNGGSNAPSTTSFKFNSGTGISSSQPTRTGYTFTGWNTAANGTGTSFSPGQAVPGGWGSFTLYAQWKINAYTNYVSHWTWGYKNGEGNNGGKTAFHLGDTSFSANYGSTYTMDSSRKTTIPNGFYLSSSFGTAGITGSWAGYSMPRSVTQNAYGMTFEYDYYPYDYTITYNLNGGTNNSANPSSYNVLYGVTLKNPTKKGYTFAGWYEENTKITGINEGKNASFTSASDMYNQLASRTTGNKTLTAKWEPITYTVVYNGNGNTGGSTASSTHTYDVAKNLTTNGFTKTGYSFVGWNTKADGSGTSYADKASVKNLTATDGGTVTLYAQWSPNTYTYNIKYVSTSGKDLGSSTVSGKFDTSMLVSAPEKTGYITPEDQTVNFDSVKVKTIIFVYDPITYTISYTLNGGSVSDNPTTYNVESESITLKNPTRKGYTFKGWTGSNGNTPQTSVTIPTGSIGNRTYVANWETISYSITYDLQGGTITIANPTSYTIETDTFTLNNPAKKGYTFKGWTGSNGNTPQTSVSITKGSTGNLSFTANWTANTYTIKYKGNGNTGGSTASSTHTYDVAKNLTANGFIKTGYSFAGWNTKADGSGTSYADKASVKNLTATDGGTVTLYAQWSANTYTVYYNGNGNTGGSTASSTHTYDVVENLTANGFIKTGHTFAGWNTKADGSGTSYADKASVKNLIATDGGTVTLYAQWSANQYSVSYNANGGTGTMSPDTATYGQPFTVKDNQFSRPGYKFVCWNEKSDGTGTSWNGWIGKPWIWTYTKNITLYAQWNVIPPTISAKKGFFYQDSVVTQADLRAYATAHDIVEGNISHKIIIDAVILPNGTKLSNPSSFTASILGDYTVKYTVENERGASASVENIVTVVQRGSSMIGVSNKASIYSRYISNEVLVDGNNALDTLESQSIWRTYEYSQMLNQALNNSTPLSGYEYVNESTFKQNARRR